MALFILRGKPLLRAYASGPKRGRATLGSGASPGFDTSDETGVRDAPRKRMHSGVLVVGHQPAGSMANHEELRDSGLEGWSSITPEFRFACIV